MRCGALASCEVTQQGLTWLLAVQGEADHACVETVEAAAKAVDLQPAGILTVDLTRVTFVDTSFIRWLLGFKRRIERPDASFVVIVRPGRVQDVIAISGLDEELAVVEDGVSAPGPAAPA